MKVLVFLSFFLIFSACVKDQANPVDLKFKDLFYKKLKCTIQSFATSVYIYSPHIIGIWIKEKNSKIEYFRSLGFNEKENALFFESIAKGDHNFQTTLSPSSKKNKRIKIIIQNNVIKLVAIKKLDEENKPVEPLLYQCLISGGIVQDLPKG